MRKRPSLTWAHVAAWRMERHHLTRRRPRREAMDVVSRVGGLHAQVMSSAEISLWARVKELQSDAVPTALWTDRTLVKTWAMRGTLHLLPASDYPVWQSALSGFVHFLRPSWAAAWGLTVRQMERLIDAIGSALEDRVLTREELAAEVRRRTRSRALGEAVMGSWGSMLKPAAYRGLLCFAPGAGSRVRFTSPRTWLGPWDEVDRDDAFAEVTRRFLGAYGPVTGEDYARWWAADTRRTQANRRLRALGAEAIEVDIEGEPMWALASHVERMRRARASGAVRLLPAFDPYVIGASRHVERLMPGPFRSRVFRNQGWLTPVVVADGRIVGLWTWKRRGRRMPVRMEALTKLDRTVRVAAEAEVESLGGFLGLTPEIAWADERTSGVLGAKRST